jgi:hypothetical protein
MANRDSISSKKIKCEGAKYPNGLARQRSPADFDKSLARRGAKRWHRRHSNCDAANKVDLFPSPHLFVVQGTPESRGGTERRRLET